jgi:DNA ligase-1
MRDFAQLYEKLDATRRTNEKVAILSRYFSDVKAADGAWAVYYLTGRKLRRLISTRDLRVWAAEDAKIPLWLLEESYAAVGDLAETVARILPAPCQVTSRQPLHEWVERYLLKLRHAVPDQQHAILSDAWSQLDTNGRLVWNKLITGGFRVGVSRQLVVRALAATAGLEPPVIALRLMGDWEPKPEFFRQLISPETDDARTSRPFPFMLANPWHDEIEQLGESKHWMAEWKWDGIRAQLIHREDEVFVWSRGEELITDRFPELIPATQGLPPGTVLDGEIVAARDGAILPFTDLQRRIGRKRVGRKILKEVPVKFIAFDVLEYLREDFRQRPLAERRAQLERILVGVEQNDGISLSEEVLASGWDELAIRRGESRELGVEGLMLKRRDSEYAVGRQRGLWWKWKVDPYSVDAVMIYAQFGHGRRASLYTDYTFGVWHEGELVPFAKAYSGLSDEEIREVDRFVRRNIQEKFGPVRRVNPELVFELAFENIHFSRRHKSGVAVRFPRILRWRRDKTPRQANSLDDIRALLPKTERHE